MFDSHFHALIMEEYGLDVYAILQSGFSNGLTGAMEVAVNETNFDRRMKFAQTYRQIRLSAGIHPASAYWTDSDDSVTTMPTSWENRLMLIEEQAGCPDVTAIGECGIDLYRHPETQGQQEKAFIDQLQLAHRLNMPVIIHNRQADTAILKTIKDSSCRKGVLHCFDSNWDMAKKVLDMGYYISFAGNITYPKKEALNEVAKKTPLDRILVETDSPFLSPQPVRQHKNQPDNIRYTLKHLAGIRGIDVQVLAEKTAENARELFY